MEESIKRKKILSENCSMTLYYSNNEHDKIRKIQIQISMFNKTLIRIDSFDIQIMKRKKKKNRDIITIVVVVATSHRETR